MSRSDGVVVNMFNKTIVSLSFGFMCCANAIGETLLSNNATIAGACNIGTLGVYSGTANATPHFEPATYVCDAGYYLPADAIGCVICPMNNYCVGGAFQYNTNIPQGIMNCPNQWLSPAGMHELESCGHILYIGDSYVYLRNTKKTTPALNILVGDKVFYANVTTADVPMNIDTERKLKISDGITTWSVYDDTVNLEQE